MIETTNSVASEETTAEKTATLFTEITNETIALACQDLVRQGIRPTYESVRRYFQFKASPRIKVFLAEWRRANANSMPKGTLGLLFKIETLEKRIRELEALDTRPLDSETSKELKANCNE